MKVVTILCPLCASHIFESVWKEFLPGSFIGKDYVLHISICKQCGFAMQNPRMKEDDLDRYYKDSVYYHNCILDKPIPKRICQMKRIDSFLARHGISSGKLLDVGCYSGHLLDFFKARGWNVWGIEPNNSMVKQLRKKYGQKIALGTIEEASKTFSENNFDVVILNHVLEHLYTPQDDLRILRRFISGHGYLYIEVPDAACIPSTIINYFSVEHLNYFTKSSLVQLLNVCGYEVVDIKGRLNKSKTIEPNYPVISALFNKKKKSNISVIYNPLAHIIKLNASKLKKRRENIKKKIQLILKKEQGKRIVIWGAGVHSAMLFGLVPELSSSIVGIIDNNKDKWGEVFNHTHVFSPDELSAIRPDSIIISSYAAEEDIYKQINESTTLSLRIIRLYEQPLDI